MSLRGRRFSSLSLSSLFFSKHILSFATVAVSLSLSIWSLHMDQNICHYWLSHFLIEGKDKKNSSVNNQKSPWIYCSNRAKQMRQCNICFYDRVRHVVLDSEFCHSYIIVCLLFSWQMRKNFFCVIFNWDDLLFMLECCLSVIDAYLGSIYIDVWMYISISYQKRYLGDFMSIDKRFSKHL